MNDVGRDGDWFVLSREYRGARWIVAGVFDDRDGAENLARELSKSTLGLLAVVVRSQFAVESELTVNVVMCAPRSEKR